MSLDLPLHAITYIWSTLGVVWFLSAARLKTVQQYQAPIPRALHMLAIVLAFALMFYSPLSIGWLRVRILPQTPAIAWTGVALVFLGIAIAIWARLILGSNWSGSITLKQGHSLVRTGPYRWVRHPIYSGLVLAAFGTALAEGRVRSSCGVLVMLTAFLIKARSEDNLMRRTFGAEHDAYCEHTGVLLPKMH